ncbi:hypothetical protein [Microtetraspora sp. NBRC 16547]|uniref:hypothetical protein n=1 Tax=Microtetraspora sp. NBRC 16547 TaxID=3030993 RepID=UPI0024A44612|nr:hypothetical protein [Microtetraspora sp. NBRC 16547]GLX02770.1 hypothetical protein Misp02_68560 [Microtetraspora sp. NBRC 16547]
MASKNERDIAETIEAARLARQEGRAVFVVSTKTELSQTTYPAWDLAGLIEAVEREGWILAHTSETAVTVAYLRMTCIFRRHDW